MSLKFVEKVTGAFVVIPVKTGIQNLHYISPFAKGETKRGSRIPGRPLLAKAGITARVGRNDD